jgi:hypothetical protein
MAYHIKIQRLKELERQFRQKLRDKNIKNKIKDAKSPNRVMKLSNRDPKFNKVFKDKSVERIRQQFNKSGVKFSETITQSTLPDIKRPLINNNLQ